MKTAVVFMLSLLCLEVTLRTAAHIFESDTQILDLKEVNKKEPVALTFNEHTLEKPETRLGFFSCLKAVKVVISVAWKGWRLYKIRSEVGMKATEERQKCQDTSNTPDDLQKCLQIVEDKYKKAQKEINEKIFKLLPEIRKAFWELLECFA